MSDRIDNSLTLKTRIQNVQEKKPRPLHKLCTLVSTAVAAYQLSYTR